VHGYNQGSHTVRDLILSRKPAAFLIQEHWLTPANLSKFEFNYPQYMCFGSSAMSSDVESGVLRGRRSNDLIVDKSLSACTKIICASDRYVIVIIGNLLIINVYMPCAGTTNRVFIMMKY